MRAMRGEHQRRRGAQLSRLSSLLHPPPISFCRFNSESCSPGQSQQIEIAADQHLRFAVMCEIKKWLILRIPADLRTRRSHLHHIAPGQIVAEQLSPHFQFEPEFWIGQDAGEFRSSCRRYQRYAVALLPIPPQPFQPTTLEQQSRDYGRSIKNDSRTHERRRAHATASSTSCSAIPSCASRARTSSARLSRSGRSTIRSPSVLTSK